MQLNSILFHHQDRSCGARARKSYRDITSIWFLFHFEKTSNASIRNDRKFQTKAQELWKIIRLVFIAMFRSYFHVDSSGISKRNRNCTFFRNRLFNLTTNVPWFGDNNSSLFSCTCTRLLSNQSDQNWPLSTSSRAHVYGGTGRALLGTNQELVKISTLSSVNNKTLITKKSLLALLAPCSMEPNFTSRIFPKHSNRVLFLFLRD